MAERAKVGSPCIGVCEVDAESGFCKGCLRTVEEIIEWRDAEDGRRLNILRDVGERRRSQVMRPKARRRRRGDRP